MAAIGRGRRSPLHALGLLLVTVLVLAGCGGAAGVGPDGTGTVRVVQASRTVSGSGLYLLAQDWGIFARHGIQVETITAKSGSTAMQTLVSGDADLALTGTADALVASAKLRPVYMPVRVFSGTSTSLVVRRSIMDAKGVAPTAPVPDRLRALQGLTIATVSASSNTTGILRNALATVGGSVKETYLDQNSMVAAFRAGQIDGFMASPPNSNTVAVNGLAYRWIDGPNGEYPGAGIGFYHAVLAADSRFADAHPAAMAQVIAALVETSDRVRRDPATASTTLHTYFPEVDDAVWNDLWAQIANSFGNPVPTAADLAVAVRSVVPERNRQLVEKLDLNRLLGQQFIDQARSFDNTGQ